MRLIVCSESGRANILGPVSLQRIGLESQLRFIKRRDRAFVERIDRMETFLCWAAGARNLGAPGEI